MLSSVGCAQQGAVSGPEHADVVAEDGMWALLEQTCPFSTIA